MVIKTLNNKGATVTLGIEDDGRWIILGQGDGRVGDFRAEITPCKCGKPTSGRGACDGWHVERINKVADAVLRTYGRRA